ncbi:MAG: DNA helicase RecQ [Alteromonadaceae bacterium]|nr:MAG: DNA helicase RecQ [Alteromonadaceae bacterium]
MNHTPLDILQHTFGYGSFRDRQADIVNAVCQGKNALVVMPTGGGKSLCYQIPALVRPGIGIVISPLIALMQDQVNALKELGIRACFLNSTLSFPEVQQIERDMVSGGVDLVYIAPERLNKQRTIDLLARVDIALFAIDEAHCVAQWGHDFRVDYLRLDILAQYFPSVPRVALTATADSRTQEEIASRLTLDQDAWFICGFDRPNIQYHIRQKKQAKKQLIDFIRNGFESCAGIVYCLSRKRVEDIAQWMQQHGVRALPYHAGMSHQLRQQHQNIFLREEGVVIVATIAFGMGIDKPNVRYVVHMDMPKSLEAYYQETGRAGRDGDPSTGVLFYGMEDVVKLSQMAENSEGDETFKRHEQQRLNAMLGLCEMITCRRQALLRYFGEQLEEPCGNCDNCLIKPKTWDATEAVQKALSCVYRTEQRFGAAHVIDVLRGSDNAKVKQFGHDRLSTYDIGSDMSVDAWRTVFRQLVVMGHLQLSSSGYGNLMLTEKCRGILRGKEKIYLREEDKSTKAIKRKVKTVASPDDMPLWNALRALRKELADEHGVPPYIVFNDATLKDMIQLRPRTKTEFLVVNGVGDKKLEQFGAEFLAVISEY